jgi:hypothetical protein
MPEISTKRYQRILKPVERTLEVWFGLIMVLTLTCSISVAEAGREEIRTMLPAALGCNLVWGIIDGFMYLVTCFSERGHALQALRAVRRTTDPAQARGVLAHAMPELLAAALSAEDLDAIRQRLNQLPEPPSRPYFTKEDWLGALGVFLLVFLSTFPVVIPFLFIHDVKLALRTSNGIALVMLFLSGRALGHYAGYRPWRMGLVTVVSGSVLVAAAIALGG